MVHAKHSIRVIWLCIFAGISILSWAATGAFGFQRSYETPPAHERQCVPTGEIPPGDARTITLTWKHPFASDDYNIIGAVSEPGDSSQAIELGHIVIPHSPTTASAVVYNRNAQGVQSGVLCLDASVQ